MNPVPWIALSSTLFVVTHFVMSHPPARAAQIARLGDKPFLALYSLVSFATWGPAAWLWWTHRHAGTMFWATRSPVVVHLAEVVIAVGVALSVAGVANPAPSSAASAGRPAGAVRGIHHVTRHPVFVGSALLAGGHLLTNGFAGDLWFLGSHVVLGIGGALHQDYRMNTQKPGYPAFAAATTVWPNPLGLPRIGGRG
ncbi:MAG: NnrU family protein, partial [Myxococcota bacterium]